jgi:hypothetical protein
MMMIDILDTPKKLAYNIKFECADDLEFEQVAWKSHAKPGFKATGWQHRHTSIKLDDSASPKLCQLVRNTLASQYSLLTHLWTDNVFKHIWAGYTPEVLLLNIEPYFELCKDMPGFHTDIHVDHRRSVTGGMLFFNKHCADEMSTVFYDSEQGANPVQMTCGHGQGWYSANWHNSWHSGFNTSDSVRYSLKFGLHLKKISA